MTMSISAPPPTGRIVEGAPVLPGGAGLSSHVPQPPHSPRRSPSSRMARSAGSPRPPRESALASLMEHVARTDAPFVIVEGPVEIDTAGFVRSASPEIRDRAVRHLGYVPVAADAAAMAASPGPAATTREPLRLLAAGPDEDLLSAARRLVAESTGSDASESSAPDGTSPATGPSRPALLVIEHADRLDPASLTIIDLLDRSPRVGVVLITSCSATARRFGSALASERGLHLVLEPMVEVEIAALTETITGVPASTPVARHLRAVTAGLDTGVVAAIRAGLEVGWLRRTNNWVVFNGVPVMLDEYHAASHIRRLEHECGSDHIDLLHLVALLGDLSVDEAMEAGAHPDLVFDAAELGLLRIDGGRVRPRSRLQRHSLELTAAFRMPREVLDEWWSRSSPQTHPRRSVFAATRAGILCTDAELLAGAASELDRGLPMRALALCAELSEESSGRPEPIIIRAQVAVFLGRRAAALDLLRSADDPTPTIRRFTAEILVFDFGNIDEAARATDDPAALRTLRLRSDLLALPPRAVLERCVDIVDDMPITGGDPGAAARLRLEMASVRAQCHAYVDEPEAAEALIDAILDSDVPLGPVNRRRLGRGISRALLALGRDPDRLRTARWGRPSDGTMLDVSTRQVEHTIHLLTSGAPLDDFRAQVDQLQDILISPLPQPGWLTGAAEVLEIIGCGQVGSVLEDPLPVIDSVDTMRAYGPIHSMLLVAARVLIAAPDRIAHELEGAFALLAEHPGLMRLLSRTVALRRFIGLDADATRLIADALGARGRDASLRTVLLTRSSRDDAALSDAFAALVSDRSAGIDPRGIAILLARAGHSDSSAAEALVADHPDVAELLAEPEDGPTAPQASPEVLAKLTERERSVALEAVRGSSNVAIAAALDISKRTAETHLRNIYRKLAVSSRQELYAELIA